MVTCALTVQRDALSAAGAGGFEPGVQSRLARRSPRNGVKKGLSAEGAAEFSFRLSES